MSPKPDGEQPPANVEVVEDEESDEYDVEYDDEEIDDDGDDSQEENAEKGAGSNLTALLLGDGEEEDKEEGGSADEGWTPDGAPEPAEDSGEDTDNDPAAPAQLKGKAPAVTKRERDVGGDDEEEEEASQSKRAKA